MPEPQVRVLPARIPVRSSFEPGFRCRTTLADPFELPDPQELDGVPPAHKPALTLDDLLDGGRHLPRDPNDVAGLGVARPDTNGECESCTAPSAVCHICGKGADVIEIDPEVSEPSDHQ